MKTLQFTLILLLLACSGTAESTSKTKLVKIDADSINHSTKAKEWLEFSIDKYFNQDLTDWSSITTSEYNEYKLDMINAIYSDNLSLDYLNAKWSHKYEVGEDQLGLGFLFDSQDYYKIVIQENNPIPSKIEDQYMFNITLCDTQTKQCYESIITVIKGKESYAIDNVIEKF